MRYIYFPCFLLLGLWSTIPQAKADVIFQIASCYYGIDNADPSKVEILGKQQAVIEVDLPSLSVRRQMLNPTDWCTGPYENNQDYIKCERGREKNEATNIATLRQYEGRDGDFTSERRSKPELQSTPRNCRAELRKINEIEW